MGRISSSVFLLQRLLSFAFACLFAYAIYEDKQDPNVPPQVVLVIRAVHAVIGAVIASQILPRPLCSILFMYCGLFALVIPQQDVAAINIFFNIFRPLAVMSGLLGFYMSVGRKVAMAVTVVGVALVVNIIRLLIPLFIAEDVLPRPAERMGVETPEVRAMYCNDSDDPVMRDRLGIICNRLEPLSWEQAEKEAERTLLSMTSAERHSLMQGIGWVPLPKGLPLPLPAFPKRGYYMGNTPPIPRLGVPALKLHDAGNGFRNMPWPLGKIGTTIMWPCSLAFAATWDVKLIGHVAEAIAREYRGKGANLLLGPSVQVHRVARNGRNFEYMSGEDPYLGAQLASAYVRGVQSQGVIACLKHFAFNEQETRRMDGNSIVDARTAWELYYPPFEAGVEAGAGSIMCSYNKVNGTYSCANEDLLARDLKKKMNFRGFVMSDWWALHDKPENSVVRGFDQEMPGAGGEFFHAEALQEMEKSNLGDYKGYLELPKERLYKDPAFRILAAAWKMNLFNRASCTPGVDCVNAIESDQRSKDNNDLAKRVAIESVMLLQNDGSLPIRPKTGVSKIALIGQAIAARSKTSEELGMDGDYYSGGGSGHCFVSQEQLVTPLERIKTRAKELNLDVISSPSNDIEQALKVARQADVIVVHGATTAEEMKDRANLNLDHGADDLISALAKEKKPIVVLVQAPGTVLMPWREEVSAIAMMFLGGEHTGSGWASVIFGDVSPSGKLPIMIPKSMEGVVEPSEGENVVYSEGLFTSYRSKNAASHTAFPFGHGLSYTTFEYSKPKQLGKTDCAAHMCIQTAVSNIGKEFAGSEVAQAYVEFPPDADEPKLVMRGFHKTAALKPGETEVVTFSLTKRDLSIYREGEWQLQRSAKLHIGASSANLHHIVDLQIPI